MPTLWDPETRAALVRRVAALSPAATPRWGTFTAPRMLAHLTDALRMATGELPVARRPVPWVLYTPPFKQLIIHVLPFPRGAPTAPELVARLLGSDPVELDGERAAFAGALDRFAARGCAGVWPDHPAFGPLRGSTWGVLQARHADHHLRQFGV
ncbi:MAG: DUF1569 domain-containing protein [Gemmatimonadetes bacterium]|nr:DUF1569 domain-containing protein [Gemmatimonadota bacterium]MBK7922797.1 DUF1569 domain-containing protein [Gemmatimonadota bacterium]MBK9690798.1 DUF1569 domain-containing protein [Gemmatimonadota bacterium]